jgi:hypothetical protein
MPSLFSVQIGCPQLLGACNRQHALESSQTD